MKSKVMKDLARVRRNKIIIKKQAVTEDEVGNQLKDWVDWQAVWVEVNSLFGVEYYSAKAINEENTVKFTMKYAAFADELDTINFAISYKGELYDIKHIDRIKDNGEWVIVRALKRGV